jgi:hypothetical protein
MLLGFSGHAEIVSFQAPLICESCDEQTVVLFDTGTCIAAGGSLPATGCPSCGQQMEIDDLEEHYLHFVHRKMQIV